MEKSVFVLFADPPEDRARLATRVREELAPRLLALGVSGLVLHLADEHVAYAEATRRVRQERPIVGLVSVFTETMAEVPAVEELLREVAPRFAGYRVDPHVALPNSTRVAPLGERTPDPVVVAFLERPERLSAGEWRRIWREEHVPVAIETQSTFHYVRNVVREPLTEDVPAWEGIVEEGFPHDALLDPKVWYAADGDEALFKTRFRRMMSSVKKFLDPEKVESIPTSEYRLRLPL